MSPWKSHNGTFPINLIHLLSTNFSLCERFVNRLCTEATLTTPRCLGVPAAATVSPPPHSRWSCFTNSSHKLPSAVIFIESLRLEKTFKIIKSNRQPSSRHRALFISLWKLPVSHSTAQVPGQPPAGCQQAQGCGNNCLTGNARTQRKLLWGQVWWKRQHCRERQKAQILLNVTSLPMAL